MKHTQGPWKAIQNDDEGSWSVIVVEKRPTIGTIYVCEHISQGEDEGESDANLIAAAPELLEALEMELWAEENGEAEAQDRGKPRLIERLEIMRSIIKKAKGNE